MSRLARHLLPLALVACCGLSWAQPPQGFEASFYLVGHKVKLNGTGAGSLDEGKAFVAGLYLTKPARSLQEAQAAPGPKRLQLKMLREMGSQQIGNLLTDAMKGIEPRAEMVACLPGLAQIGEALGAKKRLTVGEQLSLDWVMGQGTYIIINEERVGTIKGQEFFGCVLKGYLGEQSPDATLKKALLTPPKV